MLFHIINRLAFILLITIFFACTSSDKKSDKSSDAGTATAEDGSDTEDASADSDGGSSSDDGGDTKGDSSTDEEGEVMTCPNNELQEDLGEECDDGNFFNDDGCTRLCEFTCTEDLECDDGNICNGIETCDTKKHTCERDDPADDGDECGTDMSCFSELCRPDVCGDLRVNSNEDCDDGNANDDDGCTTKCKFTCDKDKDCEDGDACAGATTCNTDDHTCGGGELLDDQATCKMENGKTGWCFNHVCVPTDCGDGVQGGDEKCDEGSDNGKPGSGCSIDCQKTICGDGEIQGDEQCDDENQDNYDGCDENCKAELYYRWTKFNIIREPAPKWCKHAGKNSFAEAFPGEIILKIMGIEYPIDELAEINDDIQSAMDTCWSNPISQIFDLDDPSFKFSDDTVRLTSHIGELKDDDDCDNPLPVDTVFYIKDDTIDDDGQPKETADLIQRPGLLKLEDPITVETPSSSTASGAVTMHDFQFILEVDMDDVSTPDGVADTIEIPNVIGGEGDADDVDTVSGRVCAAMDVSDLSKTPVTGGTGGGSCCSASGEKYRVCNEGDEPGKDCDSHLDILINGCIVCIDLDATGFVSETCEECDAEYEVIHATPPDVDADGDGKKDSYTMVFEASATRVRSIGLK